MVHHNRISSTIAVRRNGRSALTTSSDGVSSVRTIPRWPRPMIESNGDYRAESYLEDLVGGPLYEKQANLPRLPIPRIHDTLALLKDTVLPLAESENEKEEFLDALESFEKNGLVTKLQERLIDRSSNEFANDSSWLSLWWNQLGYLQVRDPVVINVSYFFHFRDDWTLPIASTKSSSAPHVTRGIMRAATILHAAADFRKKVCSGSLQQEHIGRNESRTSLCSVAYKYMFHACRIPYLKQDGYRIYDPSIHTHGVIASKGYFFKIDFIDPDTHEPLSLKILEESLVACTLAANELEKRNVPKIGWLTSGNRDDWAYAREQLIHFGGAEMERALESLESGAILICLDDECPESRRQCGNLFWHGGHNSGGNRWFDKSVQIICSANGKAGLIGEHSMMDGMPMVNFANTITKTSYESTVKKSTPVSSFFKAPSSDIFANVLDNFPPDDLLKIRNITNQGRSLYNYVGFTISCMMPFWNFPSIETAELRLKKLIDDHDLSSLNFQAYGSSYIKQSGFSPDAYVQIAMQLATYRLFGKQVGTYEASQVRRFKHGRTETTRTVSPNSNAFLSKMGLFPRFDETDSQARLDKLKLLEKAVSSHVNYLQRASKGMGVDRHLLGLSLLVNENEETPSLFNNELYKRSKHWRVSTSNLSHPRFENWGYGEVVPDGKCVIFEFDVRLLTLKYYSYIFHLSKHNRSWSKLRY